MMGKIWESRFMGGKKPLNFSDLPLVHAALAGERLRPLGHISADAYSQANLGSTRRKNLFLKLAFTHPTQDPAMIKDRCGQSGRDNAIGYRLRCRIVPASYCSRGWSS